MLLFMMLLKQFLGGMSVETYGIRNFTYHMNATMKIACDGRQIRLTVALLRLPLSFTLEESLLQLGGLQVLLLAHPGECLVEARNAF